MRIPPFQPSEPPTPSEYKALIFGAILLFGGLGLVGLGYRLLAPSPNPETGAALLRYAGGFLVLSVMIAICYWVYRRLVDYDDEG